jgi:glucan phosphoethanolaminetransferase (alkaline phosphatase superfamily)
MKNKLLSFLLLLAAIFLLLDAFTNIFSDYAMFKKIVAIVLICLTGTLIYFSLIVTSERRGK